MADSFTENILGVSDLIESSTNKTQGQGGLSPEGVVGEVMDVLDLPMSDDELLDLKDDWETQYATYEGKVAKPIRDRNLRSYLGRMPNGMVPSDDEIVAANLQFESEETFLPAATAQDPSPFVFSDDSPEGNKLSSDVQTMLQFHAQQLLLRRKIAVMVRQWSINQLGVLKAGWKQYEVNKEEFGDVAIDNRKIQDFLFDPDGYVDVHGDFSSWLGERIYLSAEKLSAMFPKHKAYIKNMAKGKMGTEVCYTEWWNDDYCFSTFKDKVLDKHKNEFFNYDEEKEADPLTGQIPAKKRNHFAYPKKPYIFLSVYSLQERPHDITGLIEQNIPTQNKINRRDSQIDEGVSAANNGVLLSEDNFNQETGKQAVNAIRTKTGFILVPSGRPINEAMSRLPAPQFPESAFKDLENSKNDLRNSWGTQGIASQEVKPDETAKGMTLNQSRDTTRIGGGIGDVIEQSVAKGIFDWLVQLYQVFYDEPHFGAVLGSGKATEYVTLSAQSIDRQLIVGVTANSMKPKDQISEMNQATQLFEMKAIGPKTLLEALSFPDPDEAAGDGVLYNLDPMSYFQMNFPELAQKVQQFQQQQAQAQAAAQQQQIQMEAQSGQQELAQKQQAGQQQLQQGEQAHAQKMQHEARSHIQKLQIEKEKSAATIANKLKQK